MPVYSEIRQQIYAQCDVCGKIYKLDAFTIPYGSETVIANNHMLSDEWRTLGSYIVCPKHRNVKIVVDSEKEIWIKKTDA